MLRKTAGMLVVFLTAGSMAAVAQTSGTTGGTTGSSSGSASGSAMQLSQSECESLWNQADSGGAGALSQTQAQNYVTNFSRVDANSDGRISRTEFMQGCSSGQVQRSATTGGGTGTTGSSGSTTGGSSSGTMTPKK
jgi:hypothetical protein